MAVVAPASPGSAYDCLAPFYDGFTAGYSYDRWISAIEQQATALGLSGRRALDLACGTGKSTEPLLKRGYSVIGCDISEGMVHEARRKFPEYADRFLVADMRELPDLGEFDLVLCLDDAMNYLLSEGELEAAFAGAAAALSASGLFVFDLNSLSTYRTFFAETAVREADDLFFVWRGEGTRMAEPGEIATAKVEIFSERDDGLWERRFMRHVQRHHPPGLVRAALARAGLECARILGQRPGVVMDDVFDETRDTKLLYFCRRM